MLCRDLEKTRTGPKSPPVSALLAAKGLMEGKTMSAKESSRTAMQVPVYAALLLDCTTRAWSFFSCSKREEFCFSKCRTFLCSSWF